MNNRITESWDLQFVATAAVTAGDVVLINDTIGIAQNTAAIGENVRLQISGKFELVKINSIAFVAGEVLYWDATPGEVTTTALSNHRLGTAALPAALADTQCRVNLNAQETTP